MEAWKLGLKAVAIYRDGCKRIQPLNTGDADSSSAKAGSDDSAAADSTEDASGVARPVRRRLPTDCSSYRHKFEVAGHEGYIHVGFYDDGTPGEIFIKMAKEGSTISGLMDTLATLTSLSLQYGVPLSALVSKFSHVRFEPSGFTKNPDIPIAKSLTDYIFRFLGTRFGQPVVAAGVESSGGESSAGGESGDVSKSASTPAALRVVPAARPTDISAAAGDRGEGGLEETSVDFILPQSDAPSCADCGAIMVRNGACYKCLNCGATSGCS